MEAPGMTKRKIQTSSELHPEPIDFDEPMERVTRELLNALQGLKSYCYDNHFDFEEATLHYQAEVAAATGATQRQTILGAIEATIEWVQGQVGLREAQKAVQEATTNVEDAKVAVYFEEIALAGFPKDRAAALLAQAGNDVEAARHLVADEMRRELEARAERDSKLTVATDRQGRPLLVNRWNTETWRERIRRQFGI
jgi:hypothetical protein